MGKLCDGKFYSEWESAKGHALTWWEAQGGERPTGVKRRKLKCPKCGRRLWSSVNLCHDGCCLLHSIPPHKPKHWWKHRKELWLGHHN